MTPLRQHMSAALQLSGKRERTQQSAVREVRLLAPFYGTSPHLIAASELQPSMLHRKNVDHRAPTSRRICYRSLRFFSLHILERDWKRLDLLRAQAAYRLPAIRSVQEVHRLLSLATPLPNRVYFPTVYSLGRRLHEGSCRVVALTRELLCACPGPVAGLPRHLQRREAHRRPGRTERPPGLAPPWNVPSQVNPHGATSLQSLAPYVFKVAIANRRMVSLQDPLVTCTYRPPGSARPRTTPLDVLEFMRRFLPHVRPSGFMQGRHLGFMRPRCVLNTPDSRRMTAETNDAPPEPPATQDAPSPPCSCPPWGGALRGSMRVLPAQEAFVDTG